MICSPNLHIRLLANRGRESLLRAIVSLFITQQHLAQALLRIYLLGARVNEVLM
jgi:hypothetical protein